MAQALDFGKIKDSCSNLTSLASNLGSTVDTVNTEIGKIQAPAWVGKASEAFRDKITTLAANLPEANRQLAESVIFLASCADAYDQLSTESANKLKELIGGQDYIDKYDVNGAPEVNLSSRYGVEEQSQSATTLSTTEEQQQQTTTRTSTSSGSSSGYSGSSRYSYSVGPGGTTSSAGVVTTALVSAAETTSSLTSLTSTDMTGKEIEIPDSVKQGYYTCTGYDYWIDSGREMSWQDGTNQKTVSDIWKEQGSVFKNGIAVINVDGEDRYLIAVTTKFGMPGDCIDVTFADGTVVKCIIADSKGDGTASGSEWGHALPDGSVNVLEFEVQREKILQSGNPTTDKWDLPWDSNQPVKSMKNTGSIIGAKVTDKTVITNNSNATLTNLVNNAESTKEVREVITDVAETQLNNTDEKEYVKMFGESEGEAWCSEFVSWCAKKSGYNDTVFPKFSAADEGATWFKDNNLLQGRDYTPNVGDVLFTGGDEATHTALVVGVNGNTITTIEGNVGDQVVKKTHTVGDSDIYGYGTPDYSKLVKDDNTSAVTV
ncbi:MAG: CHAP domain-containing protein [Bacilli bacterium]|nr:CHAP domain-containing protein [Bacilli bacterium]